MIHALRWQTLVPRVLVVIVALLAGQYLLGLAARSVAVLTGEAGTGGGVEVAHAKVSLWDGKVVFSDVRLASPHSANEYLLEADRCELYFAGAPVLHKQAVVNRGRISGLRFGKLPSLCTTDKEKGSTIGWGGSDDAVAHAWLANLGAQFKLDRVGELDSVKQTEALYSRWSSQSADLESRAQQLEERAAELQRTVEAAQSNPLRNDEVFDQLPEKIAALKAEFDKLRAEHNNLPDWLDSERRSIVAARRSDDVKLQGCLRLEPVDASALSGYLLRDQVAGPLNELMAGLRWIREAAPADAPSPRVSSRGENVLFAGCKPVPGVLIHELELQGAGRCGGQPVELRGLLTGLNTSPSLHSAPVRLRLVSTGSIRMEIHSTVDRTGSVARDELLADCQGILLPQVSLGRANQFAIGLAPSVGSLSVSMNVEGESLSGELQIVQRNVRITPKLGGELTGAPIGAPLGDALGQISSVATRVTLGGTIAEPTCTLWSNLGPAVAEAMEQSMHRASSSHERTLLTHAGKRVDERLAEIERQIAESHSKFVSQTTNVAKCFESIAGGQASQYRISAEQLGRRLPNNSLFR